MRNPLFGAQRLYIAGFFCHNGSTDSKGGAFSLNPIQIPTLLFWENGNSWYGSSGSARFFIKPDAPEEGQEKQLIVRFWRGPLSMELSEILSTAAFPLSEEGLLQTSAWLEQQAEVLTQPPSQN